MVLVNINNFKISLGMLDIYRWNPIPTHSPFGEIIDDIVDLSFL